MWLMISVGCNLLAWLVVLVFKVTQYFKVVLIMVIIYQLTLELRRILPLVNNISVTFTKVFKRAREKLLLEGEFYMTWDLQQIITFHQQKRRDDA